MEKRRATLLILLLTCLCNIYAERRLALIVGNSEYGKNNYLENPVHDAEDVSSKLATLGFEVIRLTDATLREMHETISDFGVKAKEYDVVLFYYSGHGLQTKGENYLMPIDAELKSEADVRYACLPLNLLLDKLDESGCPMKIIVLDACRNNPFVKKWYRGDISQGLASVSPPKGTYITFSTAAGSVASDGLGRNSPYTTAFLETLEEPNLSLFDFFNEVGQKVLTKTNGDQDPWTNHNTMRGKFLFNISANSKDSGISKQQSVLPTWLSKKSANEWIGISVPIPDKEEAKKMAVLSALLKYIASVGGIQISLFGEVQMVNYQTKVVNYYIHSNETISFDILSKLDKFNIEIINEFYNNNNEYFVLCSITEGVANNNSILVSRKMQTDVYRKASYAALSVEALINNEAFELDYDLNNSVFVVGRHHLAFNGRDISKAVTNYADFTLCSNMGQNAFPLIDMSECGCMGLAELALIAQLPIIPKQINVRTMSEVEQNGGSSSYNSKSLFQCTTTTRPVHMELVHIKNQHLYISLQDPYEALIERYNPSSIGKPSIETTKEGVPVDFERIVMEKIVMENIDSIFWENSFGEGGPIMLDKTLRMFCALDMLSRKIETLVRLETSSVEGNTIGTSTHSNSVDFSCYYPFFFLDGQHSELKQNQLVVNGVAVLTTIDN